MKALTYIEIDIDRCALRYGETNDAGTCPAVLGIDSAIKCHNSLGTCPSTVRANFVNEPVTLRFAVNVPWLPDNIRIEAASVESVNYSPGIISLGKDLGTRSSLSVTFLDHPHSDTGMAFDKYLSERDYDPYSQGSYWGKFRARNPFLRTRAIRLIQGLEGQSLAEMDTRHFIMDSFNGPTADGKFTITAKDTLKLADGDRAQYPTASTGYLAADLDDGTVDHEFTLLPSGIGDIEYPESGYLNIGGKEVVSFERVGDVVTLVARGELDTEPTSHRAGDRVQVVESFVAADPADVLDVLLRSAGVQSSVIPLADWKAETSLFYRRVVTTYIVEPTSIKTLINELINQCGLAVWWDDVSQKVRLMVLRQINTNAKVFDLNNIVEGSLTVREQPEKCITGSWVFFGHRTPFEPLGEPSSYRSSALLVDLDVEENWGTPAYNKIFSRFIPYGGRSAADRLNEILIGRFQRPPRHFTFKLFRRGTEDPKLGEGIRISGIPAQDATGRLESVPAQIIRLNPGDGEWTVEAEEQLFIDLSDEDPNVRLIIIDAEGFNLNLRELHDILFPPAFNGMVLNVNILSGVIVGSTDPDNYAMTIGDWPKQEVTGNRTSGSPIISGLTVDTADWAAEGQRVFGDGIPAGAKILSVDSSSQITLDMNATSGSGTATNLTVHLVIINLNVFGRISGAGGRGGDAGSLGAPAKNGRDGGTALYTRYAINLGLNAGSAEIWGGGGGGAGSNDYPAGGAPGGGGAGRLAGAPGVPGSAKDGWGGWEFWHTPAYPGTPTAGGLGAISLQDETKHAGDGGGPGLPGGSPSFADAGNGTPGLAGQAIDGISYVIKVGSGDIRGAEVN